MKALEIELIGDLGKLPLPKEEKRRRISNMLKHTGNLIGSDCWAINLPFKIPLIKYQPAKINLEEVASPNKFLLHIPGSKCQYAKKILLGYYFC